MAEKKVSSKLITSKYKKFYLGTGCNSLNENLDFIKYAMEYDFNTFLIMPPAYYKGNTELGVMNFYSKIIKSLPKIKIILYNFEKLSGFKFEVGFVKKLINTFPRNIVGCKDSSYNLYENLKVKNFMIFPGMNQNFLKD